MSDLFARPPAPPDPPAGHPTSRSAVHPEVESALAAGRPVVALESTILAHGLPRGDNRRIADEIEARVREAGAVPATIAVLDGAARIGLSATQLDRLCESPDIAKLSVRDLGPALALGIDGATTVASTAELAHRAGISTFATGGLGGVHRGAGESFDVSADLQVLSRTPIVVVCAGVKSILDVAGTLEYLETMSVPVLGYGTDAFPGFYLTDSGESVPWRVDTPGQVAAIFAATRQLGVCAAGLVVANPIPIDRQLDIAVHDDTLASGLALLAREGVRGKQVTPRLLEYFHSVTAGESLRVNVELVLGNAFLAGRISAAIAGGDAG